MSASGFPSRTAWITTTILVALALLAGMLLQLQPGGLHWRDPGLRRWVLVLLATLTYAVLCMLLWKSKRSEPRGDPGSEALLVVHSSQTGHAEQLARQTAQALEAAGMPVRLIALHDVDLALLAATRQALFIASTTGEGDAPDEALHFIRGPMAAAPALELHYGLLALGDRKYTQFCGWGRRLDEWLRAHGATPLFARIEVDNDDPVAIEGWRDELARVTGGDVEDWQPPEYTKWKLVERRQLNVGSLGAPCFHVVLAALQDVKQWQAGDVLAVALPGDPPVLRDYSIASLPTDGAVHLLVRQTRHADGSLGLGSGWLTHVAAIGDTVQAQLRSNASFHAPEDARPMVLIGNGTGMAGLRALLKARIARGRHDNWLVFGERRAAQDFYYREEVEQWLARGQLQRLDAAFSRDDAHRVYVQDRLHEQADRLAAWVTRGAAIYVCGSAQGMAAGVDSVLRDVLGAARVDELRDAGRYRRDVY